MPNICVVHLVRKKNGILPFRNFLDSYLKNPAGVEHDLLILYKGFSRKGDIDPYEKLLKNVPHSCLMVADFGFDLRPYFVAAEKINSEYFCFLNSFSVILDKDWLLKIYRHINQPGVGLAGATASWGSIRPGQRLRPEIAFYKQWVRRWAGACFGLYFNSFPNYHLRTNGFIIARNNMLKIKHRIVFTKMQAWLLESGVNSITNQISRMGLRAIVVGKDGKGYEKNEWDISNTFWRGTQPNLLISDNQTRKYESATHEFRLKLELFAWGTLSESCNKTTSQASSEHSTLCPK